MNMEIFNMKNIHILPTDKPSRLWMTKLGNLARCNDIQPIKEELGHNVNIYITSDEEINQQTKPCWCINTIKNTWDADLIYYQGSMPQYHYAGFKKIILTTDQDLINDGVQAITNTFAEWFVKNPSCEYVEIGEGTRYEDEWIDNEDGGEIYQHQYCCYKIIIPQEEPKDVVLGYKTSLDAQMLDKIGLEEPKQETLEERAARYDNIKLPIPYGYVGAANDFINGAKWQQEKMYSEKDMREAFKQGHSSARKGSYNQITEQEDFEKWFEQFKKK